MIRFSRVGMVPWFGFEEIAFMALALGSRSSGSIFSAKGSVLWFDVFPAAPLSARSLIAPGRNPRASGKNGFPFAPLAPLARAIPWSVPGSFGFPLLDRFLLQARQDGLAYFAGMFNDRPGLSRGRISPFVA